MELFYQVFDKGMLEDGEGREIDFKNTVILLTSNVGTDLIMKLCADPDTMPDADGAGRGAPARAAQGLPGRAARPHDRGAVLPDHRRRDARRSSACSSAGSRRASRENHAAEFIYGDGVVDAVAARCNEVESGARNVDHILTHALLPEMSRKFLTRMAAGESFAKIEVGLEANGDFRFTVS